MRISDWSSDVCSSDLEIEADAEGESDGDQRLQKPRAQLDQMVEQRHLAAGAVILFGVDRRFGGHGSGPSRGGIAWVSRSEEHTSELQSLMRISYAVFCLKKQTQIHDKNNYDYTSKIKHILSYSCTKL